MYTYVIKVMFSVKYMYLVISIYINMTHLCKVMFDIRYMYLLISYSHLDHDMFDTNFRSTYIYAR